MSLLRLSSPVSIATLLLVAASMSVTGSFACSNKSSSSQNDGGIGGAASGNTGGATGTGGSAAGTGGHVGTDAGPDVHADASGAGGAIVLPDAGPNNYTCAELLACCNSVTVPNLKTMCLQQYNATLPMGDTACGNTLFIIKAYGGCP